MTDALGEPKELGMVGQAGQGRGFGEIALSGLELGEEGLTEEFISFPEHWEWGVRSLISEGNGFAVRTDLSAEALRTRPLCADATHRRHPGMDGPQTSTRHSTRPVVTESDQHQNTCG